LRGLVSRAEDALRRPERLAGLQAELLDRLGLALQEAGQWGKAAESFEGAYGLSERLGLTANLGRNRRSVAYSFYRQAEQLAEGGEERAGLLRRAEGQFRKALELFRQYGVLEPERPKGGALLGVRLQVAPDKAGATEAAEGFTAEQEKRLCQAFLTKIGVELGDLGGAEKAAEEQLAGYPPGKTPAEADAFGVSLLFHRAGHLAAGQGQWPKAFDRFRRAAEITIGGGAGGAVAAGLSVADMAHAAIRAGTGSGEAARRAQLASLDRSASALLRGDLPANLSPFGPWYHNTLGVHWKRLGDAGAGTPEAAALGMDARRQAWGHFEAGLKALAAQGDRVGRDRGRLALQAGLHLNLAELAEELGDRPRAEDHRRLALEASRTGLLPELEWRALAGLGRREEGLDVLRSVTVLRAGCGPGEVADAFGPLVGSLVGEGRAEDAFHRAELLSELERVHRLAPVAEGRLSPEQGRLLAADVSIVANKYVSDKYADVDEVSETATGAGIGALVGGTAGLLAGIGLLAIPGLGPVVAAGWLASTALGAAADGDRSQSDPIKTCTCAAFAATSGELVT
jgi:tetratricopeptide (TPR) repeat protein